jgi:hypothetical protein
MHGTAWSNGSPLPTGAGYGVRISIPDRDRFLERTWSGGGHRAPARHGNPSSQPVLLAHVYRVPQPGDRMVAAGRGTGALADRASADAVPGPTGSAPIQTQSIGTPRRPSSFGAHAPAPPFVAAPHRHRRSPAPSPALPRPHMTPRIPARSVLDRPMSERSRRARPPLCSRARARRLVPLHPCRADTRREVDGVPRRLERTERAAQNVVDQRGRTRTDRHLVARHVAVDPASRRQDEP